MSPVAADRMLIRVGHSPDPDDAFMFYGLATKKIRSNFLTFRHVLEDIETLNRKAMEGCYDLSVPLTVSVGTGTTWFDVH